MSRMLGTSPGNPQRAWDTLMAAAQDGDAASYRQLLSELDVWLRRYYSRRLPSSLIDDIVQDVLVAVHVKRHTYDPSRPLVAWLAAIARYKWIDAIRTLEAGATETLEDDVAVPPPQEQAASGWSLENLLNTLKPAQAEAIRLVKLEGHSVEEAAQATGQSTALVKVNIHRGLKRLAGLLRRNPDEQ
jgi:RNA polymerase sigma factor (sigma-70 family)